MTLRQLEIFRAVQRRGSLSGAARDLGLTQPAVSMQIKGLTREIGTPLLRPRGRRLEPTDAGRTFDAYAERILRLVAEARTAASLQGRGERLVRVAASSTPGANLLPARIGAFRRRNPKTLVRLEVLNSEQVEQRVAAGDADFGVVGGQLRHPGLIAREWREDKLALIVARDHPLAGRRQALAKELTGETLLAREQGSATRATVEAAFLKAGVPLPTSHVLGDTEAIKRAVAEGLGIGIVSRFAIEAEVRAGSLAALRIAGVPLTRPLRVVFDPRRELAVPARELLAFLGLSESSRTGRRPSAARRRRAGRSRG